LKSPTKFTQIGIFGLKKYHLATLMTTSFFPRIFDTGHRDKYKCEQMPLIIQDFEQGCQIFLGPDIPKRENYTKRTQTIPNGHKIYHRALKYSKSSQNIPTVSTLRPSKKIPKIGFLGKKINNLATLILKTVTLCVQYAG
jgi:hypothetical protein